GPARPAAHRSPPLRSPREVPAESNGSCAKGRESRPHGSCGRQPWARTPLPTPGELRGNILARQEPNSLPGRVSGVYDAAARQALTSALTPTKEGKYIVGEPLVKNGAI